MKKSKFISFLLAIVMILSTFTPVLATTQQSGAVPDKGTVTLDKELEVTTARDKSGVKKNVITLARLENTRKRRNFSLFGLMSTQSANSQAGQRNAQEMWDATINISISKFGVDGNAFDWDEVFGKGETFEVQAFYYDGNNQKVKVGEAKTVNKGDKNLSFTVRVPKTANSINIETSFIDKLGIKAYEVSNTGAGDTSQNFDVTLDLHQIYNPVVNVMWLNPYGTKVRGSSEAKGSFGDAEFNIVNSNSQMNLRDEDILVKGDDGEPEDFIDVQDLTDLKNKNLEVVDADQGKVTYGDKTYKVTVKKPTAKDPGEIKFVEQPKIITPGENEKPGDKAPEGYKRLSFHAESGQNEQDGLFQDTTKLKIIDVLEGTKFNDKDLLDKIGTIDKPYPVINGKANPNKKFLKWKPALPTADTTGDVADTSYWPVYLANGDEVGKGDKLPEGTFKVEVTRDKTSIKEDKLYGKYYAVFDGKTLAREKFPELKAEDNYKDPKWTTEAAEAGKPMEKIDAPWTKVITKDTTFKATAGEDAATQIGKNGLAPQDITRLQGQVLTEKDWHEGVKLADNVEETKKAEFEALLKDATVTDITDPARTTAEAGEKIGTLKVTFKDGSTLEVEKQKLIVKANTVNVSFDNDPDKKDDAKAPRHLETVVKGKVSSTENYPVKGSLVEILDKDDKVIGTTKVTEDDGSFVAGTRPLKAGETIKVRATLPTSTKASDAVEKVVKLNPDRLNALLPIAKAQSTEFGKKQNAIIKKKLEALNTAITAAEKLVDKNGKAVGEDKAENQTAIDNAVTALEKALKELTANIPPTISGPKTHEIYVDEALDLKGLVEVTDGDGADDLVVENGSNVKISAVKVDGQTETPVADLSTINKTVGTYKVTYTAKDKSNAEVTHVMTLTVKPRTNSAIEVTTDPNNMKYLITEKNGKAKLDLTGMTLNLVDNLGKKTKVELTDKNVTFKVNGKEIKNGGDLTLADDVQFIEVEYKDGDNTLKAQTKGVLRVGPDYDGDKVDDRTQGFDPKNINKLEVIKQPQLDYIAKDKSEDSKFKLNLNGMIIRMTDKAGKEKLAIVKDGKFYDYDEKDKEDAKEITGLKADPEHNAKLTPETGAEEAQKGDNGKTVKITGPNNSEANTEPLKVFYDANKDGTPDHNKGQKTPAPSAMARNVGENPTVTTVEGMATPGAVIKIYKADDANLANPLTTEPTEVKADASGHYKATLSPMLADGTEIKVTAKLGEMGESDATPTKVFDDKNDNKQPDRDEGFNIAKATDIKFVDEPDLTYLVKTKDTEVTFDGKDAKGKPIYLELSYKNGKKTESKIMTLEKLMEDTDHITVTPANGTTDKKENQTHNLVGKNLEVKLKKVDPATATSKATSTSKFAIEIDADGNKIADKDETTPEPTVTARNIGTDGPDGKKVPATKTTVEIKTEPKAKVTIEYTDKDGQPQKIENLTAGEDGNLTQEINPKLKEGTDVKVTVQDGEKKPTSKTVKVFEDINNDKEPDTQTERPAAIASNKGKGNGEAPTFTTIEGKTEPGAKITVTVKVKGEEKPVTVENLKVNDDGTYTLEAKYDNKPLENGAEILVYAENAPKTISKPQITTVFNDFNNDGKPDGGNVDLTKIKDMQVIDPDNMEYIEGDKTKGKLDLTGLKVVVRDTLGGIQIFSYNTDKNQFMDGNKALDGFKVKVNNTEVEQGTTLTSVDHNNKKIEVVYGVKSGQTVQALKVTKTLPAPEVDDVKKGDKTVNVKVPTNGETKITVKVGDKEVVAEKDSQDGQWKVGNDPVDTVKGKLEIPVDELKQADIVKVTTEDPAGNQAQTEKKVPLDEYSKKPTNLKAKNEPATPDKTTITGKATPGAVITITDKDGKVLTTDPAEVKVDGDGNFTATIDKKDPNTLLLVKAKEEGKELSQEAPVVVEEPSNIVEKKPGVDKPAGFVEVRFVIDEKVDKDKGKLEGATEFYVNPEVEVQLNPPVVKPATGYKLDGWDKQGQLIIPAKQYKEADATETDKDGNKYVKITAIFAEVKDIVPATPGTEKPAGYVEVKFAVDTTKANFKDETKTKFYVNPTKEVVLTAPELKDIDPAYTFQGWDKNWNQDDNKFNKVKYEKDTLITAKLVTSEVKTPEVDDVVTGDTTVKVNPGDADKVTVVVEGQGTIVVEKDPKDGNWKTPDGTEVTQDSDGKLPVPVKPIGEKALVEVTVEKDGVESEKVAKTAKKQVDATITPIGVGSTFITVTTYPAGATVTVYFGTEEIDTAVSNFLGVANLKLKRPTELGEYYKIKVTMDGYEEKIQDFKVE